MVCPPKTEGGLGVLNLRTQNEGFLLKYLQKFYNKMDVHWVKLILEKYYANGKLPDHTVKGSFWRRNLLKLLDKYKGMAVVSLQDGSTCSLWHDLWDCKIHRLEYPELY